jgi:hypothetical protein
VALRTRHLTGHEGSRIGLAILLGIAGHACARESPDDGDVVAVEMIGPDGGRIEGAGLHLTIPAGALTAETTLEIRRSPRDLSAEAFKQRGDALALFPTGLILRQPAALTFDSAVDPGGDPLAILFEQDGLTVAAVTGTAYLNELGTVAVAAAAPPRVELLAPGVGTSPESAGASNLDTAHLQLRVREIPDLHVSLTIFDTASAYLKPLNGVSEGECGFQLEAISGGSLAGGCSDGPFTATVGVTSEQVEFDVVPFLAGKLQTPVVVGVVAGGDALAYQLGFFRFETNACFEESCSGVGQCEVVGVEGRCTCPAGFQAQGLECACLPDCDGRYCGADGCGGQCAPGCDAGEACDADLGVCVPPTADSTGGDTGSGTSGGSDSTSGDATSSTT